MKIYYRGLSAFGIATLASPDSDSDGFSNAVSDYFRVATVTSSETAFTVQVPGIFPLSGETRRVATC